MHSIFRCFSRRGWTGKRARAQSLVELAMIAPLMFVFILGIIDSGRLISTYVNIQAAAREGASYGARLPTQGTQARAAVFASGAPANSSVTVTFTGNTTQSDTSGTNAGMVTVRVSTNFQTLLSILVGSRLGTFTVSAESKAKVMV